MKVMHLPANAFAAECNSQQLLQQAQQPRAQLAGRQQHMRQQNSRPHMAIMEAVLSTNLHHPNVVQVFTYMLNPLMASQTGEAAAVAVAVSSNCDMLDKTVLERGRVATLHLDLAVVAACMNAHMCSCQLVMPCLVHITLFSP